MWLLRCVCKMAIERVGTYSSSTGSRINALPFLPISGLDFTAQALRRSVTNRTEELTTSFTSAYDNSLKQYHNFIVKGAFNVGLWRGSKWWWCGARTGIES